MMKVVQGTFRQIPYWKLRGRFHSCGYRDQEVAEHSGIGRYTMSARMNGHQPWTSKEIVAICELLDIRQDEIGELFFPTVEKGESALANLTPLHPSGPTHPPDAHTWHRRSGTSGSAGMEAGHPAATSWAGKSRTKTTPACRFLQMANGTRSLDGHWTAAAPQLTIRR